MKIENRDRLVEEWHKSRFDNWMRLYKITLAERDETIEQQ